MAKDKKPRKRKAPLRTQQPGGDDEIQPATLEAVELAAPAPRPATAVGTGTRPLPEHQRPALLQMVDAVRLAFGAMLDLADAAADVITKRVAGRT